MTKEVLIKISGMQFTGEGEPEPVEIITTGTYYLKNGKHYILYDEVMEGFQEATKNTVKINGKTLDILKKGVSNVHMMFEENRKNVSYYYTPFGSILVGIHASEIRVDETENRLAVDVKYELEMNHEHLADCTIKMDVRSKGMTEFHL